MEKNSSVKESPKQSGRRFFLGVVRTQKTKPKIPFTLRELPWQKVGMDLFEWKKFVYLIIVDSYSRFIEIAKLDRATAEAVIQCCKDIFSRRSIPEVVVMDNWSQFDGVMERQNER